MPPPVGDPRLQHVQHSLPALRRQLRLAGLVPPGPFWLDYVRHADGPFLSPHLADASRNFTEMAFALAALDLPFEPGKHEVKFDGGKMTLTPAGPAVAFHEEVRPAEHIADWRGFRVDPVDVTSDAGLQADAVELMNEVGWR